jgi:hypothetical protein
MDKIQLWANEKSMKKMSFLLNEISLNRFFKPLRNRMDIIILLLESIRIIINNINASTDKVVGEMVLDLFNDTLNPPVIIYQAANQGHS